MLKTHLVLVASWVKKPRSGENFPGPRKGKLFLLCVALFFLTRKDRLANVVGLRWAYFTRRVLSRPWGRSSEHGPDQNCHSRRAPEQPEEHQPRNSAERSDGHHGTFRLGQI